METILLVDDESDVRDLARDILTAKGYRVLEAGGGEEAVRVVQSHGEPIDLLLTDVVMPRMQGNELAARLGTLRPGVRVLYMSGYAQPILGDDGTLQDGVLLVEKPFTETGLLASVDHAVHAAPQGGTPQPVAGA